MTFIDGSPKTYTNVDGSEFVGFFAVPASIIGAYFNAVGEIFTAFSKADTAESQALQAQIDLLGKQKDLEVAISQLADSGQLTTQNEIDAARLKAEIRQLNLILCQEEMNKEKPDASKLAALKCTE